MADVPNSSSTKKIKLTTTSWTDWSWAAKNCCRKCVSHANPTNTFKTDDSSSRYVSHNVNKVSMGRSCAKAVRTQDVAYLRNAATEKWGNKVLRSKREKLFRVENSVKLTTQAVLSRGVQEKSPAPDHGTFWERQVHTCDDRTNTTQFMFIVHVVMAD